MSTIFIRRSIRQYKDAPVEEEKLASIIQIAEEGLGGV